MGAVTKNRLVFDPSATLVDQDLSGSYIVSAGGSLITHTSDGGKIRLDADLGIEYATGAASTGTDRGALILALDPSGNFAPMKVNAAGELLVDVTITSGADKAEDSASASGDIGSFVLAVRQDTLVSSVSTDGDYGAFKIDSVGALWVHVSQIPAQDAPNTARVHNTITVATTATAIPTTPLTARKTIMIQNVSSKKVYIGGATVTTSTGYELSPGSSREVAAGPGIAYYGIVSAGTADVRYEEIA